MTLVRVGADGSGIMKIRRIADQIEIEQGASADVLEQVRLRVIQVAVTEEWYRYRLPMITENLRKNLATLEPWRCLPMRRLYGRTALIVNAGASLSAQRPEIAALQDRDDLAIYVTNSASDAVKGHVRVCMESLPPVLANDHSVPLAVDATVHNSTFTRPEVEFVFFKAEGPYSKMAERFNARSLAYGTSVTTAAVAMAAAHGARRIILVGQDLCVDATTGIVYNDGSELHGMRLEINEDTGVGHYINVPAWVNRKDIMMERLGDSTLWTGFDFVGVAEWLEGFAAAHPEIECVNATAKGMHLEGWTPCYLHDAVVDPPRLPDAPVPFPDIDDAPTAANLAACRRWEMRRPEVQLYTTTAKIDVSMDGSPSDVIRCEIDMYRQVAKVIDG